jgi:hypothetical protein
MYQIKIGIPAPDRKSAGRPPVKYPFAEMLPKASFFVPIEGTAADAKKKLIERLRTNAARFKKATGNSTHKFLVAEHADPETKKPAVGVWRTE